jgi:signal peptidase I
MNSNISIDNEVTEQSKAVRMRMELYDWLQCIVTAIICGILIFVFIGRTIGVEGSSMMRTLHHKDRVIISNLFYTPGNGDIIVFESPSEQFEHPLVKRVIAIEGQIVNIDFETGSVYVDDVIIDEPYISTVTTSRYDFNEPVYVPSGYVFVLGDNRGGSTDSRDNNVGLVDTRYILGKVLFILVPGVGESGSRDWNRIGLAA